MIKDDLKGIFCNLQKINIKFIVQFQLYITYQHIHELQGRQYLTLTYKKERKKIISQGVPKKMLSIQIYIYILILGQFYEFSQCTSQN